MQTRLTRLTSLALGLGCFACATHSEPAAEGRSWLEDMGTSRADYQPLTAQELTSSSDLIVRGHIQSVAEGRIADLAEHYGFSLPIETLVYELKVSKTLKGEPRASAYLEHYRGAASAEEMSKRLPKAEVMLFLGSPQWDPDAYVFTFPERGRPAGEPLWMLPTPQGLLVEAGGVAAQPLAPEPDVRAFASTTLDAIEQDVRQIVAED